MRRATTVTEAPSSWGLAGQLSGVLLFSLGIAGVLLFSHRAGQLLGGFYLVLGGCFLGGICTCVGGFRKVSGEGRRQKRLLSALEGRELWSVLEAWKEDSLSRRVLLSLYTQQVKSKHEEGAVDADPFIDAMLTRLSSTASRVHEAGSFCLSVAVLGTMAGLTLMLADLQVFASTGALVAGDGGGDIFEKLFSGTGPLASLGTAFASSLVGGAAKLVLSSLANELHRGAEHVTEHLADAIARDVGPSIEGGAA